MIEELFNSYLNDSFYIVPKCHGKVNSCFDAFISIRACLKFYSIQC